MQLQWIEHIQHRANELGITAGLTGSFAGGHPSEYSDVDVLLLIDSAEKLRALLAEYPSKPALMTLTARPAGIVIAIFENGVCADLDLRRAITREEWEGALPLSTAGGIHWADTPARSAEAAAEFVGEQLPETALSRLFHRSLIKWLSHKCDAGEDILGEICEGADIPRTGVYTQDIARVYRVFQEKYPSAMPAAYCRVLENLLAKV